MRTRPATRRQYTTLPLAHVTLLAALRCDGIDERLILDRHFDEENFTAQVEQFVLPTLSAGGIVLMDNVCGERKGIRQFIRSIGARLLFLPPYSPGLSPIEQVFAKLKTLLRKTDLYSVEATWSQIGSLLDALPPHEGANYLRNSVYASA